MRAPLSLALAGLFAAGAAPLAAQPAVEVSQLKAGGGLRLLLDEAWGASWRDLNVARLSVREPGSLRRLASAEMPASKALEVTTGETGCSLLEVDLGPPAAKSHADSWRRVSHATKRVLCAESPDPAAELEARLEAAALMTAKTGSRVEVRPYLSPTLVRPGSDLPVRVYFEAGARPGAEVTALGPGGEEHRQITDAEGIATFRIDAPGIWRIRYVHEEAEQRTVGELVFEVAPLEHWKRLLGGR